MGRDERKGVEKRNEKGQRSGAEECQENERKGKSATKEIPKERKRRAGQEEM